MSEEIEAAVEQAPSEIEEAPIPPTKKKRSQAQQKSLVVAREKLNKKRLEEKIVGEMQVKAVQVEINELLEANKMLRAELKATAEEPVVAKKKSKRRVVEEEEDTDSDSENRIEKKKKNPTARSMLNDTTANMPAHLVMRSFGW